MKKIASQFGIALACLVMGFVFTHQLKVVHENQVKAIENTQVNSHDIMTEIEDLKAVKANIEKKNNEILAELKRYEELASKHSITTSIMKKDLDATRMLLGLTDVQGQGVIIYLTPKTLFNNNIILITDEEIIHIINELYYAGAEAIAVNDVRITGQSVITLSQDGSILINDEKIPRKERITIKAIGDKNRLDDAINFPYVMSYGMLEYCQYKTEKMNDIKIPKYKKEYKYDLIENVKDKK